MKLAILAVALATACGSAPDAESQATPDTAAAPAAQTVSSGPKACDLVSAEDVRRSSGVEVRPGITTHDYGGASQCRFDTATGEAFLIVTLHTEGRIDPYQKVPGSVAVDDLGDSAVWSESNAQLAVRNGTSVFSISFLKTPAQKQWATKLAAGALAKLKQVG